ncbi:MAG: lysophospholipid acyltransferase family protein [Planctomycetota bacterium]
MTVVFDRPYEFVPPHRGTRWPSFIQRFRLYDWHLRRNEGVHDYELRNVDVFGQQVDAGNGLLITPNHCRYADPLVLGWPARAIGCHVHAIASWHLFAKHPVMTFALQKMGAFSLQREGRDKKSIDTAIQIVADAERPLVIFPEGSTYHTNDYCKPLLDGVSLIARTASRRAAKQDREVSLLPVGIKYVCMEPAGDWIEHQLRHFEQHLGWKADPAGDLVDRTVRLTEAMVALRESQHGIAPEGDLDARRSRIMHFLVEASEDALGLSVSDAADLAARCRAIRTEVNSRFFGDGAQAGDRRLRRWAIMADDALELAAYPPGYLDRAVATDTRVVETIQRMQAWVFGKAQNTIPLKSIIEFEQPIQVPPEKAPRGQSDPILVELKRVLDNTLSRLTTEARPIGR